MTALVIACLHSAESNIDVFDAALRSLRATGVTLHHTVRADLLAAAERAGELTPMITAETAKMLHSLCAHADAVLLTCSTLGPAAEIAARDASVPIVRVDAALAQDAVRHGERVIVLCTVETTMEPTRHLFETAARTTGAEIVMRLVPGAWAAFKAGNRTGYLSLIAQAAEQAARDGAPRAALAQASMADAAALVTVAERPLSSPMAGLAAAIAAAS